jgi:hypothetical protein
MILFQPYGRLRACAVHSLLLAAGLCARAAQIPSPDSQKPDVQKIVQDASWNELHPAGVPQPFRFRLSEQDPKTSDVKLIVQTKDGTVARLIAKNGRPLTPTEDRAEVARLNELLDHPEIQQRRHRSEHENSTREDELVRMLPNAFLYAYEGMAAGPNGPCYALSFNPNPAFVPPDREGEVFHGMVGELWIDQAQLRIVRIDAHLVADVNFGWGFLGKLFRGGSILEENAEVGPDHWESTQLKLVLQGKILMMKNVDFSTLQTSTDFRPVPPGTGYQDAVRMLLDEKSPSPDPRP